MATATQWLEGARPRTLPMAVAPIVVGTAAAYGSDPQSWLHAPGVPLWMRAVLALLVSLFLQAGVNYANDYSDGIRGTDDVRVGPVRLTASGLASASSVKRAAFLCFGAASLAGLALVFASGLWWLILLGAICVLAAWWYTGGKHPYGYLGLGDIMVLIFFGLVATLGTTGTQILSLPASAWVGGLSVGFFAMALLMANNVRDIPTDREVGKMTLAVRLGDRWARRSFAILCVGALLAPLTLWGQLGAWSLLPLACAPLAISPIRTMLSSGSLERAQLIPVLKRTGILSLVFSLLWTLALLFSA